MITIRVEEHEDYWECGDGCCTNWDVVSVFHHEGETYEYRSCDGEVNIRNFLEEHFQIKFEYE
jgi:uncharacterized OsmC-like protein